MNGLNKNNGNLCGYIDGLKEAKRLVSEGRAQLESAKRLESGAFDAESFGMYKIADEKQEFAGEKNDVAIEKIKAGLEEYIALLTYENIGHFPRIKRAIEYTIEEFREQIPPNFAERYYNALLIGPE